MGRPEYAEVLAPAAEHPGARLGTTTAFTDFTEGFTPFPAAERGRLADPEDRVPPGTGFSDVPYPYAHQLHALERLEPGDDWVRAVCNGNASALFRQGRGGPGPGGSFLREFTGGRKLSLTAVSQAWAMTTTSPQGRTDLLRTDRSPIRVLVVDDEAPLAELLSMALRYEGWEVRSAGDGAGAVRTARDFRPDAVVLDVMLPDMGGLTVLGRLRRELNDVPVLFLTARDAVEDRIAGLTAGGDDYVTKPFSLEEVVARLRGLIRRSGTASVRSESTLVVGDLVLDEDSHEVSRGDDSIHLTATEFELLRFLMRNPRRVLSKAQILDRVWNYDFGGQANVVELYISYLRKKIDAGRSPMIHTRRGAGYLIKPGA